jgi:hypothetical protein
MGGRRENTSDVAVAVASLAASAGRFEDHAEFCLVEIGHVVALDLVADLTLGDWRSLGTDRLAADVLFGELVVLETASEARIVLQDDGEVRDAACDDPRLRLVEALEEVIGCCLRVGVR